MFRFTYSSLLSLVAISVSTPVTGQDFDVVGFRVGMSAAEFEQRAETLVENPLDFKKEELGISSPYTGELVEDSLHIAGYKFRDSNGNWTAKVARKPLDPVIYEIRRSVAYTPDPRDPNQPPRCTHHNNYMYCQNLGPNIDAYRESLAEKYGEPIHEEQKGEGSYRRSVELLYANGPVPDTCKSYVLYTRPHSNYLRYRLTTPSEYATSPDIKNAIDSCPVFVSALVEYINRDDQATLGASFHMVDLSLQSQDQTGFDTYWTEWVETNLERPKTSQRPVL